MKKVFSLLLAVTILSSLLAACGTGSKVADSSQSQSSVQSSTTAKGSASDQKTKLRVWNIFLNQAQDAFSQIISDYNGTQQQVEIVSEYIPFAEIKKQLSIGLASSELPALVTVDNPDYAAFAQMGVFEDITEKLNTWGELGNYYKGPVESVTYNGKIYGLPLYSNCLALFYNETMLKGANIEPPKTFEEVKEAAKKLTTGDQYGLAVCAVKSEEGTFQFLPWAIAAGGDYKRLESKESVRALQLWTDMVNVDKSVSKEVINWTQADAEKQFAAGKAAMMINGPWQVTNLKKDAPDVKWSVTLFPSDKASASVLGGFNLGIIKGEYSSQSFDFLKYINSKDEMAKWCQLSGYLPPRTDVAQMDTWQKDPVLKVFMDQMNTALPRGPHPKWPEFSGAIQLAIQEALTQSKTPEQALTDASAKVSALLN